MFHKIEGSRIYFCMRGFLKKKKISAAAKVLTVSILLVAAGATYLVVVGRGVVAQAVGRTARAVVIDVINDSNDVIRNLDVLYEDYFSVHYNDDGSVDTISANTGLINQINMIVQTEIQNRLDATRLLSLSMPFGAFTGSAFLSNFGIETPIRAQMVANCHTELKSDFRAIGINTTLHRLQIDCIVKVDLIVPTDTITEDVNNEILLCETVIAGKVPSTYIAERDLTNYLDLLPD